MTRERMEPFLDAETQHGYEQQLRDAADKLGPPDTTYETEANAN